MLLGSGLAGVSFRSRANALTTEPPSHPGHVKPPTDDDDDNDDDDDDGGGGTVLVWQEMVDSQQSCGSTSRRRSPTPFQVFIAKYSYDPDQYSPNENPDVELALTAGDYLFVYGDMDEVSEIRAVHCLQWDK